MGRRSMLEYLQKLRILYQKASKTQKTELLSQAEHMTGKKRRTLWRYLGGASGGACPSRFGPQPEKRES